MSVRFIDVLLLWEDGVDVAQFGVVVVEDVVDVAEVFIAVILLVSG